MLEAWVGRARKIFHGFGNIGPCATQSILGIDQAIMLGIIGNVGVDQAIMLVFQRVIRFIVVGFGQGYALGVVLGMWHGQLLP